MKKIYASLLCLMTLCPGAFASQTDQDERLSRRMPTLFLEEGDHAVDQQRQLMGRLYRESTLGEKEALALKKILLNPKGNDSYTYHQGMMYCQFSQILGNVPDCLKQDNAPRFVNFSVPLVSRRNIPETYDWTVRYDNQDHSYFFIIRLIHNVITKKAD